MKNVVNERFVEFINSKNENINSIAKVLGIAQPTLQKQIKGVGASISLTTVLSLLELFPDLSAEWLLRGEGNPSRGYRDDKGTEIHIDASGDHIQGNNNKNTIGASSEELIELRIENKMLKEQVEDLRKDKDNLTKLLLK